MIIEMNQLKEKGFTDCSGGGGDDNFLLSICFLLNIDVEIRGLVMSATLNLCVRIVLYVRF